MSIHPPPKGLFAMPQRRNFIPPSEFQTHKSEMVQPSGFVPKTEPSPIEVEPEKVEPDGFEPIVLDGPPTLNHVIVIGNFSISDALGTYISQYYYRETSTTIKGVKLNDLASELIEAYVGVEYNRGTRKIMIDTLDSLGFPLKRYTGGYYLMGLKKKIYARGSNQNGSNPSGLN